MRMRIILWQMKIRQIKVMIYVSVFWSLYRICRIFTLSASFFRSHPEMLLKHYSNLYWTILAPFSHYSEHIIHFKHFLLNKNYFLCFKYISQCLLIKWLLRSRFGQEILIVYMKNYRSYICIFPIYVNYIVGLGND